MGINREILRLAMPSILASVTIPLVGIVDTAVVGRVADVSAIGGIAVGSMLFDLLYWNFGFLRVGTGGLTAQAFGRNEQGDAGEEIADIFMRSSVISIGGGLLIWLLQAAFYYAVMAFVPCSEQVREFAHEYFFIRVWAAPATLWLMAFKGFFIGMQNTVASMIVDLVVNIVNIIASVGLALFSPVGAIGVAWGTLIAQYTGLLVALLIMVVQYRGVLWHIQLIRALDREKMLALFVFNSNLFVRSLCFMVVYVGFTALAAKYGDTELALSSIMMKIFMLFSYFVDGFAYAGEALVGRFVGAQDKDNVRQTVQSLAWWGLGITIVSTLIMTVWGQTFVGWMANDMHVFEAAKPYQVWLSLMPCLSCAAFLWDGVFIGAADDKGIRNCMIWASLGFILTYIVTAPALNMQALYLAYMVHLAVRGLYLTARWHKISGS